uniref:Uncharacterized protein n=1 Tax=Maylandia zebra TaxID=106582 RepID=A0A3P9CYM4_9CICH
MENSSLPGGSAQSAGSVDFITLKQVDSPEEGVMKGLGAVGRAVFLQGSGYRTVAEFMAVLPTETSHLMPAFWDSPLSHGINVFVGLVLCFTMLGLGCTVEVSQLGEHIRRPSGAPGSGVSVCYHATSGFLLALAFSLDDVAAMACSSVAAMNLSRAWINTPVVNLLPLGHHTDTLQHLSHWVGVMLRYRYTRVADIASLWSLLFTLVLLFILTGAMLGPELRRAVSLETGCQNVQLCTAILKLPSLLTTEAGISSWPTGCTGRRSYEDFEPSYVQTRKNLVLKSTCVASLHT